MKISICITTFNRYLETITSFIQVIDLVDEVVISDDCSTDGSYEKLKAYFGGNDKVKIYQNGKNIGCYLNKRMAMSLATNQWAILLDSDNILDSTYPATLRGLYELNEEVIYNPSFAKPSFDFRAYSGQIINKENIKEFIDKPMIETMFNAQNFFVHRGKYLSVFDDSIDPVTSDSIYFAKCWIKAGNSYLIVPGLEYEHQIHEGSHYKMNAHLTPVGLHESIVNELRNLS